MNSALQQWLKAYQITIAEKRRLAAAAGWSMQMFYLYSSGHRRITTQAAARLERASLELSRVRTGAVPVLSRGELCRVCAECPHHAAAAARKGEAA
jgi:hypothetical protein